MVIEPSLSRDLGGSTTFGYRTLPFKRFGWFDHLSPLWCPKVESNHRHKDFQSFALPTELSGHILFLADSTFLGIEPPTQLRKLLSWLQFVSDKLSATLVCFLRSPKELPFFRGPLSFQSFALPTELSGHILFLVDSTFLGIEPPTQLRKLLSWLQFVSDKLSATLVCFLRSPKELPFFRGPLSLQSFALPTELSGHIRF